MPPDRLKALELHFSTEYEHFRQRLTDRIGSLRNTLKAGSELVLPSRAEFYDDLVTEYDAAEGSLRQAISTVSQFMGAIVQALSAKIDKPFERSELPEGAPDFDTKAMDRLIDVIRKHNRACDDFDARVAAARVKLEADAVASDLDEYVRLRDAVQSSDDAVKSALNEVQRLTSDIVTLEREIVEHHLPAAQLNEDLRTYLGHNEIQLEVKDTGYTIKRNGVTADALSEGETTAFALLYFLKSLEDRRVASTPVVVVLDDPVSSLDQNALFAAFGFIRAKTQNAAQIFVLAHNFTFFRLVREWFRNLRGADKRKWNIYMLACKYEVGGRCASIRAIDPLLMDYETEYHYLFARLHRLASEPATASLAEYYEVPSVARRVLETFLAFRFPGARGQNPMWSQMSEIQFDEGKKSRIYRFLQTHSHRNAIGDPDEDLSLLAESPAVLNDLLAFMNAADPEHCSRMIALVTGGGAADAAAE